VARHEFVLDGLVEDRGEHLQRLVDRRRPERRHPPPACAAATRVGVVLHQRLARLRRLLDAGSLADLREPVAVDVLNGDLVESLGGEHRQEVVAQPPLEVRLAGAVSPLPLRPPSFSWRSNHSEANSWNVGTSRGGAADGPGACGSSPRRTRSIVTRSSSSARACVHSGSHPSRTLRRWPLAV
jgi:hypothetical protein